MKLLDFPPHGTRRRYQGRRSDPCRCLRCCAANAQYSADYRHDKARHLPRLGSLISATEARRRIRQLKAEKVLIWKALGLRHRSIKLHTHGVTLRTLLKLRALCRKALE